MPTIDESGYPLVFKVPSAVANPPDVDDKQAGHSTAIRVYVRALEGMQKEAVVALSTGAGQQTWRMVSDEGPYLDGTDLAPFPLGFFSAGMQFSLLNEVLRHAKAHDVALTLLELVQDNYYSMNGSALAGTMIGGAKPVEVQLKIEADASAETIAKIIALAEQSSPAHALMREVLSNTFSLNFNEKPLPLTDLATSSGGPVGTPDVIFEHTTPDSDADYRDEIITKVATAERVEGVEGGASSSLQPVQKRILHVHGHGKWVEGNLLEATAQVMRPIGSKFRFECEANLGDVAQETVKGTPPPLAYLSAGVGFCYMTQLGRYAHITKQHLQSYQIIQENIYVQDASDEAGLTGHAFPFDTHVFIEADEADEVAQKTVSMSERTCFLHAAMRDIYPSIIQAELNGEPLSISD